MKKLLTYIAWPALAGLSFAVALLLAPRLATYIPALAPPEVAPPAVQPITMMAPVVSYKDAIRKAAPAVVSINSLNKGERQVVSKPFPYSPFRRVETLPDERTSLGSGVIIDPAGYIVTSYHVFFGDDPSVTTYSPDITVTLQDGTEYNGNLVALDEKNDLALLKINVRNLPFLTLSNSSQLAQGDVVLAIGNPRNIGQSVSAGIISALWSSDDSFVIQTDAAINPGNSGGALVDVNGDLIGINSTIVSESGGSEGISFAIAADKAKKLLNEYLSTSPGGYLGVDTNALSLEASRESFDLDLQGFIVNGVTPNGPADKAGVLKGDIITGVDDQKLVISDRNYVVDANRAMTLISNLPPGKLIVLEVYREGKYLQLPTLLGKGRPNYSGVEPIDDQPVDGPATASTVEPQQ